jgi:hypothetical protein
VNHAPAAADDSVATTEDTAISTINVLLNDADPDGDTLTVTEVTPVIGGTPSLQSDGTVRFTPSPNFNGLASFSYAIADGRGGVATAAVAVNVTAASDPPAAPNISMTTIETTPVTITPAIVDPDSDDTLTLSVATAPSNGTAVPVGNTLVYSARPTYIGPDAFTYRVTDSSGLSATGTVTIVVKRRNAAPVCSTAAPVFAWPPNHKQLHKFTITGITDADRDPLTVAITAILQDEPVDTTADGKFTPDASFSGATFWVRAERMGGSNGRVYEIRFTVTDGVGGSCSGTRLAVVPHAMGRQPRWVDDGVRYNSLAVVPSARNKK